MPGGDGLGASRQRQNGSNKRPSPVVAEGDGEDQGRQDYSDELRLELVGEGKGLAGRLFDDDSPVEEGTAAAAAS
jgi:hypothetical protein